MEEWPTDVVCSLFIVLSVSVYIVYIEKWGRSKKIQGVHAENY